MKKYEKEVVKMSRVPNLMGGEFIKVEMVITEGKLIALVNALDARESSVGKDLLGMLNRAFSHQ